VASAVRSFAWSPRRAHLCWPLLFTKLERKHFARRDLLVLLQDKLPLFLEFLHTQMVFAPGFKPILRIFCDESYVREPSLISLEKM
jgi:hypothetical protein